MNALSLLSLVLLIVASLSLQTEQIREKRQMGMYSPYSSFGGMGGIAGFPSMGSPYGSMMYQRSVPMMPVAYGPTVYSPMSMGSLGYGGASNPSFMSMGFRSRARH